MADIVKKPEEVEFTDEQVMALMIKGDFSGLGLSARAKVLFRIAERHGMDPWQQPFILLPQRDNTLKLYATKNCAQQVRDNLKIKTEVVYKGALRLYESPIMITGDGGQQLTKMQTIVDSEIYEVEVRVTDKDGREETEVGTAQLTGLDPAQRRNAPTLALTRAKRRAYLNLGKISIPDEVEGDFSRPPSRMEVRPREFTTPANLLRDASQTQPEPAGEAQETPAVSNPVPPTPVTPQVNVVSRGPGLPKAVPSATGPRGIILGPPVAPTKPPTK